VLQAFRLVSIIIDEKNVDPAYMSDLLFCSTIPSHSAVTDVFRAPMSTTRAVALLCEYLESR
jgi:hypothetical protein